MMMKGIAGLVCLGVILMAPAYAAGEDPPAGSGMGIWNKLVLPFRLVWLSMKPADDRLLMPVHGGRVRQVANTWHAPRPGGRVHEGQDIFAARGTPILSATTGVVISIGERDLGGKTVSIVGPGRRTYYYAHLDRYAEHLRVGDPVRTDSVIGYVGNTGNARTASPHLHFGVFGTNGAIDPLPLLQDRESARPKGRVDSPSGASPGSSTVPSS